MYEPLLEKKVGGVVAATRKQALVGTYVVSELGDPCSADEARTVQTPPVLHVTAAHVASPNSTHLDFPSSREKAVLTPPAKPAEYLFVCVTHEHVGVAVCTSRSSDPSSPASEPVTTRTQ